MSTHPCTAVKRAAPWTLGPKVLSHSAYKPTLVEARPALPTSQPADSNSDELSKDNALSKRRSSACAALTTPVPAPSSPLAFRLCGVESWPSRLAPES